MNRQVLRLCVLTRLRARSQKNVVPNDDPELVAQIGQLNAQLGADIGMLLHKRRSSKVRIDDVMEFLDLWLETHAESGGTR